MDWMPFMRQVWTVFNCDLLPTVPGAHMRERNESDGYWYLWGECRLS